MMRTIHIEIEDERDFELISALAQRLGLPTSVKQREELLTEQEATLQHLFGSWEGEETGEELAATLHEARNDSDYRGVNL